MKQEIKKVAKIVDEIFTFFMFHYEASAEISVRRAADGYRLHFVFSPVRISAADFEKLKKRFVARRKPEIEDYYWQLAGESQDSGELRLVAMMSDTVELTLDGHTLELELTRRAC